LWHRENMKDFGFEVLRVHSDLILYRKHAHQSITQKV
jgi:hypothetical protein